MRNLSDTIARLSAMAKNGAQGMPGASGRLSALHGFGDNPGALDAWVYVPERLAEGAALVVVLHGCTQSAAAYDQGSGWSVLAEEHGFAVLYPEQKRANNANLCFNWFTPEDTRRDGGEAASIRQMVARMATDHAIDPARVFVTGLSAGGAMTAVMLATYPEVFAGGAVIAGLPYGVAASVPEAFDRMRGHGLPGAAALARAVREASPHSGAWPTLSVWQGTADATVVPANAEALLDQWRTLHGVGREPSAAGLVDGQSHRVWRTREGRDVIEAYSIAGLGHGTPLATTGADACGAAGPHMLEAGISSTRHIARFWGLIDERTAVRKPAAAAADVSVSPRAAERQRPRPLAEPVAEPVGGSVGRIIDDALRAAGLKR